MPRLSIILPVFNGEEFLKETIESVISQIFQDWELIIVNDGSTDSSEDISINFAQHDSRIKIFSQSNQGLSSARNAGFAQCNGELIGFLDADDLYLSECLDIVSHRFTTSKADLIISGYYYFQNNNQLHSHRLGERQISHLELIKGNLAPPVAHFIRKDFANELGGFDASLRSCEDWDFWIRAGKMGAKIQSIPEVLVGYRYVPTSMSRNPRVMYDSLSEVSQRAGKKDHRLPKEAPFNQDYELDYPTVQKKHLIRMLGVMLHQEKVSEAVEWYSSEKKVWKWVETDMDWKGLSSYLSWGYFFEQDQIDHLLVKTAQDLDEFFTLLGFSPKKIQILIRMIFEPQFKKRNHHRFGRVLGALKNRLAWY